MHAVVNQVDEALHTLSGRRIKEMRAYHDARVRRCAAILELGGAVLAYLLLGRAAIFSWSFGEEERTKASSFLGKAAAHAQRQVDLLQFLFGPYGFQELASNRLLVSRGFGIPRDFLGAVQATREIRERVRCGDMASLGALISSMVAKRTKQLVVGLLSGTLAQLAEHDVVVEWRLMVLLAR